MAKKKTEEKINLDSILFKCRNILRSARNSGSFFEKRDMMLTLVFLRFIGEKFEDGVENLRKEPETYPLAALVMPATVDLIRECSMVRERMPAKSTYFYPKPVSGFVFKPLE